MKIKDLSNEDKKLFINELDKFGSWVEENLVSLSRSSKYLYKRTLSYISVENKKTDLEVKEFALFLVNQMIDGDIECILGNQLNNNKNIRLSAFKTLLEPNKKYLIEKTSETVYKKLEKILSQTGSIIRNKEKKKDDLLDKIDYQNYESSMTVYNKMMKEFLEVQNTYNTTGEVPCYEICRDFLIASLYLNNKITIDNKTYKIMLRNEYRTLILHISSKTPPKDEKNYIWIDLENNKSVLYIQKSKTTGKYQKVKLSDGSCKKMVKEQVKQFPLCNHIVGLILFIKNVFREQNNKTFFKTNNRINHFTCDLWSKNLTKIFKPIAAGIGSMTLKKMYINSLNFTDYTKDELKKTFIYLDNLTEYRLVKDSIKLKK